MRIKVGVCAFVSGCSSPVPCDPYWEPSSYADCTQVATATDGAGGPVGSGESVFGPTGLILSNHTFAADGSLVSSVQVTYDEDWNPIRHDDDTDGDGVVDRTQDFEFEDCEVSASDVTVVDGSSSLRFSYEYEGGEQTLMAATAGGTSNSTVPTFLADVTLAPGDSMALRQIRDEQGHVLQATLAYNGRTERWATFEWTSVEDDARATWRVMDSENQLIATAEWTFVSFERDLLGEQRFDYDDDGAPDLILGATYDASFQLIRTWYDVGGDGLFEIDERYVYDGDRRISRERFESDVRVLMVDYTWTCP
jgi:hypothetical protein